MSQVLQRNTRPAPFSFNETLHSLNTFFFGTYTLGQDFTSRYDWTKHHIETLHKSLTQEGFWIEWVQSSHQLYLEVCNEMDILQALKTKAHNCYNGIFQCTQRLLCLEGTFSREYQVIQRADLTPLHTKLQEITLRVTHEQGLAHLETVKGRIATLRNAIEDLANTPLADSWPQWLLEHQKTCQDIESEIEKLQYARFLYIDNGNKGLRRIDGVSTESLEAFFNTTFQTIARRHYTTHVKAAYICLYTQVEHALRSLQADYEVYHSTWKNYLWSYWHFDHQDDAKTLETNLRRLQASFFHYNHTVSWEQEGPIPSTYALQESFNALFPSRIREVRNKASDAWELCFPSYHQTPSSMPTAWAAQKPIGVPMGGSSAATAYQLLFSVPGLAPAQAYLKADWNRHAEALQTFVQLKTPPSKPLEHYFTLCTQTLHTSSVHAQGTTLDHLKRHLPEQSVIPINISSREIPTTLEAHTFDLQTSSDTLVFALNRTDPKTPVGVMENLYLLTGAHYTLVSFTIGTDHYRSTSFGYFCISPKATQKITRETFFSAAYLSTYALYRKTSRTVEDVGALHRRNFYDFVVTDYRISATQALYGQNAFEVPTALQGVFHTLRTFVYHHTGPSYVDIYLRKNPEDLLEQTFKRLPHSLQEFLHNAWGHPPFLRSFRHHLLKETPTLALTPPANQQQYDPAGFLFTLMLNRLYKTLQSNPEVVLSTQEAFYFYHLTQRAIALEIHARRARFLRIAAAVEETLQVAITYIFAPLLSKRQSAIRRQAITTLSRLTTTCIDPLQEHSHFQRIMHLFTTATLMGESLDDPDLTETEKDTLLKISLARAAAPLLPGAAAPKDLAISTTSAAILRNPSPVIGSCISIACQYLQSFLVEDLPPDAPQPYWSFLGARILIPILTNHTLQSVVTEKAHGLIRVLTAPPRRPQFTPAPAPEEQAKYPQQQPTEAERKQQAEQAAHALELRHAQDHLIQKEAGVKTAYIYLDDKQDDYNDHYHQDKYYSKFKKAIKNYNRALIERDAAINKLYTLLGMNDRVKTPLVEIPKRATKWEKTKLWIGRNVEINIGINFSAPLYQMKTPGRTDPGYSPPPLPEPQPTAPLPTEAPPTWQEIQNQQIFEMNMAYHSSPDSPNDTSSAPQFPSPTVPTSGTLQIVQPRQLQRAGFVPMDSTQFDGVRQAFDNDLIKSVPKGVARVFSALCNLMLPDMSDVKGAECPKEHFQRAFGRSIEWYDKAAGIQDPNSFSAKTGEFIGEALALGGVGKVIHVVDGISVFGMACEGGFIGAVVAEAHNTNKATGVVFGFAGGAGTAKLTKLVFKQAASRIDRTLPTKPQSFGRQVRTIETLQRQTYRSGVVTERTATKLAEKSISKIQPLKLPAVTPGPELEWLSINTPKIRQLQQLKGDRFDRFIKSTFKDQDLTEVQIRRLLHFSGFKTYPRPAGLPDNVVVEFAKKNGGMAYRKLGTTEEHVRVVRVCQGLGKESMVSSTIKGQIEHGTLRQQYPYVVQRKENLYLRADGTWTDNAKDPLTHIRLGEYQFKGWE